MKHIPIHKLNNEAGSGIEIRRADDIATEEHGKNLGVHRDDHYIFFLTDKGSGAIMVDFNKIEINGRALYYILPGQVHHVLQAYKASGWFFAVDTMLVPGHYREVFENQLATQLPYSLNNEQYEQCLAIVKLLYQQINSDTSQPFYVQILHSLLNTFVGYVACGYSLSDGNVTITTRPYQIAQQFKKLLKEHYISCKSPSWYAGQLTISESYLNEALKKTTGLSVSYWINNEVILEAKRLLYYSQLTVKEIAHTLGYEDHTYFSRLFKRSVTQTPLSFRHEYRK
ncbi:MAG: AraC family transcriptional regulator [Sphingobacteriaceae bacterium]|nr:MAG: AraC family transcriptional regulator [Sphingobacteriaceae bacterium]